MEEEKINSRTERLAKSLNKEMETISNMFNNALDLAEEIEKSLLKDMTPKEIAKKKAFDKKLAELIGEGKMKEATELKNKYLNE